jgi:RNA polymerase sigma factor (sigma-70 family)
LRGFLIQCIRRMLPVSFLCFSYWFWAIARNRYAKWAEKKNRSTILVPSDEKILADTPDLGASMEDHLILKESMELLKRELSLLSSYYRDITIAYYLHGERIPSIAERMKLPIGTIKRRL